MQTILRLSLLVLFLSFIGCNSDQEKYHKRQQLRTVKATVIHPQIAPTPHDRELSATLEAVQQADIAARISGNIISLPVSLGQHVRKGELLVELDTGNLAAAVKEAEVALTQARRNLARETRLLKQHAATTEGVKNLRDAVEMARARLSQTTTTLGYTKIRAPFTGVISHKMANSGDLATIGKPLLTLENPEKMQVSLDLPESLLGAIQLGQQLPVTIPSLGLSLTATVSEISSTFNPTTRTAQTKLELANRWQEKRAKKLYSGMFALVTLANTERASRTQSLLLPAEALQVWGQMERVFVLTQGHAKLRLVRTGARLTVEGREMVEVLSGLDGNEEVLIATAPLQQDQPVNILKN